MVGCGVEWLGRFGNQTKKNERRNYKKMVYQWKPGTRIPAKAEDAAAVCNELESQNNLTASAVVDVSRPEDAVLHKCFEWDDPTAAEKYREEQARLIIRSLVIVQEEAEEPAEIRAYFNIESREAKYDSIQVIAKDRDLKSELLQQAKRDMKVFAEKYRTLSDMSEIIKKIINLIDGEGE